MTREWCILYLLMFLCVSEREARRRAASGIVKNGKPCGFPFGKGGEKRLPRNGFLSGWRCLSRLERPHPAGSREEGFGRGAGSCWNGRPHLSTAEQPQNFTHDG